MSVRALRLALAAIVLATPFAARAGDLTVFLRDQKGAPVADAVIAVTSPGATAPARYQQPLRMSQRNMQFAPFVLAVPVGADVNFSNEDKVRHQIFSFSPAKRFELKLFGQDQTHSIRFDKTGTVALGCNIHDDMVAFIRVSDAPFVLVTDGAGRAVFHNLPAGRAKVSAWQPYVRGPGNELQADIAVPKAGGIEHEFSAAVIAPRR